MPKLRRSPMFRTGVAFAIFLAGVLAVSNPAAAQLPTHSLPYISKGAGTPVGHIVIILKENRTLDEYFGTTLGSPWGFANPVSPEGNCRVFADSSCSSSPISLFHADPTQDDGFHTDVPHTRQSIVDSVDGGNMDGYGGESSITHQFCWWKAPPPAGETCVLNGSQGGAGGYTYFDAQTDLPFYYLLYQTYGLGVQYFTYATPTMPDHLSFIAAKCSGAGCDESVDNPYTPGTFVQWTCDEANVGGSQPSGCTSGASPGCSSGGFEYSSQVLSQNFSTTTSECIAQTNSNGTTSNDIAAGHYYIGGNTDANVPCVCEEGTTLSVTSGTPYTSLPNGSCTVNTTGTCSGATTTCTVGPSSPFTYPVSGPTWGGNKGSLCPGGTGPTLTTLLDLLDVAGITWGLYAPVSSERGYLFNFAAYVAHIRYGSDWTNNVHPWQQFTSDVGTGSLPQVSWVIVPVVLSEHPGLDITALAGEQETQREVQAIWNSKYAQDTLILITWDDGGGFFDHYPVPDAFDSTAFGPRVPLLCVGPYCKNQLGTMQYEPASIVRCIRTLFAISAALGRDADANDICPLDNSGMVDYTQVPINPPGFVPRAIAMARNDPDVVTLTKLAWKRIFPKKEPKREQLGLAKPPELNPEHCFAGTHRGIAHYKTKGGVYEIEVCHSPDWAEIYRVGENPMDDDEPDGTTQGKQRRSSRSL